MAVQGYGVVKVGWSRVSLKYVLTASDIAYILAAVKQVRAGLVT